MRAHARAPGATGAGRERAGKAAGQRPAQYTRPPDNLHPLRPMRPCAVCDEPFAAMHRTHLLCRRCFAWSRIGHAIDTMRAALVEGAR